MTSSKKETSIIGQVNSSTRILMIMLLLCMVANLLIMYNSTVRYNLFVSRLEVATSLKPIICDRIPEEVWSVVAGRMKFAECSAYQLIDEVNQALDEMMPASEKHSALELVVARRTMDTLQGYIQRIERNMRMEVSIDQSQELVNTVRDVGSLILDMLEGYIAAEIELEAESNQKVHTMVNLAAVVETILAAAVLILSVTTRKRLARYIRTNLERLEHFARLISSGALEARAPSAYVLELKNLTDCLNVMADRLQSLILQNTREQVNLKKSELRTLQAQINPHFLYNTLDAIMWQAEAGHNDEVIRITCALSDFFRISLSSGEDWIRISQEVKHLEGYLSIQKVRYRDILEYAIYVDSDIMDGYILKLLLQPLVENALYHGIKYKRGGGTIRVTGRMEGDELYFCVHDTGCGMSPEQLESVRASTRRDDIDKGEGSKNGSGFGLWNVDMRIRLYYNQPVGLVIDSDAGGTTVSFRVPKRMKGTERNVQSVRDR